MTVTPRLSLPSLAAGQSQKHVTLNEALDRLDQLAHLTVLSRTVTAPPPSPTEGAAYLIPASASGVWSGQAGKLATYEGTSWRFDTPAIGWQAYVSDEARPLVWTGSAWIPLVSLNPASEIGIATTADSYNRLAVASPAALFTHAGQGHQLKINKNSTGDTASLLYQSNWSGRCEMGLAGEDAFSIKTSADGTLWGTSLRIEASGHVALPRSYDSGNLLINPDFTINQRGFAGGALALGKFGHDRWKAEATGTNYSVSAGTVTLSGGKLRQILETQTLATNILTVSVEDVTGGSLMITVAGTSQTFSPASGRTSRSYTLATPLATTIPIDLEAVSGPTSFRRLIVEHGSTATSWKPRPQALELTLCRRYFRIEQGGILLMSWAAGTGKGYGRTDSPMRATPTPTLVGNASISVFNGATASLTSADVQTLAMRSATVFDIAFNQNAPATAANQLGCLTDCSIWLDAEL